MDNYKKVFLSEIEDKKLPKKVLEKINKNKGFLYYQNIGDENVGVYRPYLVKISKKLKYELENFTKKLIEFEFKNFSKQEKKEILKNNIFRIDGVLDKNNYFNIVEINSHFPRLYMLNFRSLKEYGLKKEYNFLKNKYKKVFLKNGEYKKINIIYDENIHAINDNLRIFLETFKEIIDGVYSLADLENNFNNIKSKLEKNPNVYRMIIKTENFKQIIKKLNIKNLRIINSLEVGKIGEKEKLSNIKSDILPQSKTFFVKDLEKKFIIPKDKILKISTQAEGKGIYLPLEKFEKEKYLENTSLILQDYIELSKFTLQSGEKKYNDLNFLIINGELSGAIIRLSNNKIVNVSIGGTFASCILEII